MIAAWRLLVTVKRAGSVLQHGKRRLRNECPADRGHAAKARGRG
jgi:hypothetical protein